MKCLLIGGGHRGINGYLPAALECGLDLVAVCDPDQSIEDSLRHTLESFVTDAARVRLHADLDEALAQHQPDVAIVAAPPAAHHDIAKALISAGVPFLKEKPFAVSREDALELAELVVRHDAYARVCTQRHYSPTYRHAANVLFGVGHVTSFDAHDHRLADRFDQGWRADPSLTGGNVLIDFGYHMVDVLQWFFGTPSVVEVEAHMSSSVVPRDAAAVVRFEHPGGVEGTMSLSVRDPDRVETLDVYGSAGHVRVSADSCTRFDRDSQPVDSLVRHPRWPSGVAEVLNVFLQDLGRTDLSREECRRGVAVVHTIESMWQSSETGRRVVLEGKDGCRA